MTTLSEIAMRLQESHESAPGCSSCDSRRLANTMSGLQIPCETVNPGQTGRRLRIRSRAVASARGAASLAAVNKTIAWLWEDGDGGLWDKEGRSEGRGLSGLGSFLRSTPEGGAYPFRSEVETQERVGENDARLHRCGIIQMTRRTAHRKLRPL